ncbi:MAG: hypothetical protein HY796_07855, partial [Elusimicrobia bacterium]|nr:hypothetical protein [Elusimicrobiota bacterium]
MKKINTAGGCAVCAAFFLTAVFLFYPRGPVLGAEQGEGTVKLGYFIGGRTTLFGRAFADGYFDKEGVRVELITRRLR